MSKRPEIYGLLAEFAGPEALLAAARRAREEGYRRVEAYTPFPMDELPEALGHRRTLVPALVFVGGLVGLSGAYLMQYYANVIGYPLNIGGRPLHSWPSFMPITFELTVLLAALFGVVGMLVLNGLPMLYHPLFNVERFAHASQDAFFLCIEARDPRFDREATEAFLRELEAREVVEVPQ